MVEKALARVVICRLECADLETIRVFGWDPGRGISVVGQERWDRDERWHSPKVQPISQTLLVLVHASVHAISDANNVQGTVTVTYHTWDGSHIKADSVLDVGQGRNFVYSISEPWLLPSMSIYSCLDANYILFSSPMPYCYPILILTSLHTKFVCQINVGCHLPTTITEHIYTLLGIPRVLVCCILPASKAPIPNALTNTFKFIYANHDH